jgi:ABC-type multidrug transport system, ATPase and permease components
MDNAPERTMMHDLKRFSVYVKPYWFRAVLAVGLSMPVGAMDAVIAAILRPYTDDVMIKSMMEGKGLEVSYFPIIIIVVTVVQSMFKYFSNYLNSWVSRKISDDLKLLLFGKLLRADPAMFDRTSSGEILQRYVNDADTSGSQVLSHTSYVVNRVCTSLSLIAVMFWNSWLLAIVAVGALSIGIIPLSRVRKRMRTYIKDSLSVGMQITTNYNEAYIGNRTITAYNLQEQQQNRLKTAIRKTFHISIKMVQRAGFMSVAMHFAVAVGIASILWLQGYLIVNNMLTPGAFISFMVSLMLLYNPMKSLSGNMNKIQAGLMAIQRVLDRIDEEPTIVNHPEPKLLSGVKQAIVYDNVSFSYAPDKPVLRNVNLRIEAGQTVAFVGNSGGGKSTMANLLPRFYDVDDGRITIDGIDIRDVELHNLREQMAIVFQDNFLFAGTIRDNIVIGKPDATGDEMDRAVKAACLDEFVGTLEHGLDTVIGERGTTLSGGQKQRVAIARAFLKNAPIVILDEATSALDNKSEKVVQQAIENLMLNKTVIVIAHRLSTIINADRIVVIRDGELVESGTHEELIVRPNGAYASLYRMQGVLTS